MKQDIIYFEGIERGELCGFLQISGNEGGGVHSETRRLGATCAQTHFLSVEMSFASVGGPVCRVLQISL